MIFQWACLLKDEGEDYSPLGKPSVTFREFAVFHIISSSTF